MGTNGSTKCRKGGGEGSRRGNRPERKARKGHGRGRGGGGETKAKAQGMRGGEGE